MRLSEKGTMGKERIGKVAISVGRVAPKMIGKSTEGAYHTVHET